MRLKYFQKSFSEILLIVFLIIISNENIVFGKIIPKKLANDFYALNLKMPNVLPKKNDEYFCTATNVSNEELYITSFEPDANASKIHHIIIYGCKDIRKSTDLYPNVWSCSHPVICTKMSIIYAWGRNAPTLSLPKNVGFHIGQRSEINYLVLQAHYAHPLEQGDSSGVRLIYSLEAQPFVAGIFVMVSTNGLIPPKKTKTVIDVNCRLQREQINIFAYRVHAHALGTVIKGYKYSVTKKQWTLLAEGNPQWPQAFYPMNNLVSIKSDDILFARCTYNSSSRNFLTKMGSNSNDEMCNLYLMYYSENTLLSDSISQMVSSFSYNDLSRSEIDVCEDTEIDNPSLIRSLPKGSDEPLPRNITLEMYAMGQHSQHHPPSSSSSSKVIEFVQETGWPFGVSKFGQITAVDIDSDDNIVIFQRGNHVWNQLTFDLRNRYRRINEGPITDPTIVIINPKTKKIIDSWGQDLFFLPHGLTIDHSNKAVWLTDVALHQVFKFSLDPTLPTYRKPLLTLGERFVPGKEFDHFCKPTSVAVDSPDGDFYVADGYCNGRIIRYDSKGKYLNHWGHENIFTDEIMTLSKIPKNVFNIPHKVVLIERNNEKFACVADRENGRIQCFLAPYGQFRFKIQLTEFNGRLFSIAFSKKDGILYAVNGPSLEGGEFSVSAFAFDFDSHQPIATFSPISGSFSQPHDLVVSRDGNSVYIVEIGPNNIWKFAKKNFDIDDSKTNFIDQTQSTKILNNSIKDDRKSSPNSIRKSKLIEPKLNIQNNPKISNFAFDMLRIRGKEFRETVSFNNMLYIFLVVLIIIVVIVHYRHSSPYSDTPFLFCCTLSQFFWRFLFRKNDGLSSFNKTNSSQRIGLGSLFGKKNNFKKRGFNRLPQNEEESELTQRNIDDEDDDSDVLEDFTNKDKI